MAFFSKTPSSFPIGMILVIILLSYTAFSDQGLIRLYHLRQTENMILEKNEELRQEIRLLKQEIKNLHKLPYLERVVREELGFIKPNEIVYYVGTNAE